MWDAGNVAAGEKEKEEARQAKKTLRWKKKT
jgi:hypothetical protein